MQRPARTSGVRKRTQLGRPYPPVASRLPRHDVEVIVRHLLAAVHAVVLKREYSERLIGCQQRMRDFPRRLDHGRRFFIRQFQQGGHMAARDDTALTGLELHRVDDGTRELALGDQRNGSSSRQRFADLAGVLVRQLDHLTVVVSVRGAVAPSFPEPPGSILIVPAGNAPRAQRSSASEVTRARLGLARSRSTVIKRWRGARAQSASG